MNMLMTKTLEKLILEWREQKRPREAIWPETKDFTASEINQLVEYAKDPGGYNGDAAIFLLAMTHSTTAFNCLEHHIQSNDLLNASKVALAVGVYWPDSCFEVVLKELIQRSHEDLSLGQLNKIRCGLALYRIGISEGFELLADQSKNFNSAFESNNYRDRLKASGYLAKYIRSE